MSVIGPRPALWNQDVLIAERDKYGANDVKPGLTGWAQINGRDELEIPVKAKLDGEYVQKESLFFDMYCLDLWPESLIAGGITRGSVIYKYFHGASKRIYRAMDKILITSKMFSEYLQKEFGIGADKIDYLPQYAEGIFEVSESEKDAATFDFMFAGNIGEIQSIETIIKAARMLTDEPVRFHIVGRLMRCLA